MNKKCYDLLTKSDVAALLGVEPWVVQYGIKTGRLPAPTRRLGRGLCYHVTDLPEVRDRFAKNSEMVRRLKN
jgi:hypothetical protein